MSSSPQRVSTADPGGQPAIPAGIGPVPPLPAGSRRNSFADETSFPIGIQRHHPATAVHVHKTNAAACPRNLETFVVDKKLVQLLQRLTCVGQFFFSALPSPARMLIVSIAYVLQYTNTTANECRVSLLPRSSRTTTSGENTARTLHGAGRSWPVWRFMNCERCVSLFRDATALFVERSTPGGWWMAWLGERRSISVVLACFQWYIREFVKESKKEQMATGSVRADCGSCFTYCTCCAVLQMPMKEGHEAANALLAAALDEACSPSKLYCVYASVVPSPHGDVLRAYSGSISNRDIQEERWSQTISFVRRHPGIYCSMVYWMRGTLPLICAMLYQWRPPELLLLVSHLYFPALWFQHLSAQLLHKILFQTALRPESIERESTALLLADW